MQRRVRPAGGAEEKQLPRRRALYAGGLRKGVLEACEREATGHRRLEPSLERVGAEPSSQAGSEPSAQAKEPSPARTGGLSSSQDGSLGPDPLFERHTRVEPSLERVGAEASSQAGSEPSAQAKEPSLARTGALPSAQDGSYSPGPALQAGPQTRVEPSLETLSCEPPSQAGSEPSAQAKEPSTP
jgi:hypothetical protein